MSGKPKKSSWGGARKNAGRKPSALSEHQIRVLHKKLKQRAKLEGKDWADLLLDFMYGHERIEGVKNNLNLEPRERLSAMRLMTDVALVKKSEKELTVNPGEGVGVYLPTREQDSALKLLEGGKS